MREDEIKRLVKIVEESNIGELVIKRWGKTIKISKHNWSGGNNMQTHTVMPTAAPPPAVEKEVVKDVHSEAPKGKPDKEIKSPMVGTYYSAPAPDADPYVEVGKTVKKGQVLCIIEAMKLMNEIESELSGKIVEILVENGQPVEYNQPLFRLEAP